ncbi:MAG: rRNA maturation RNase YbeY [Patescibacteria group bacterium]
MISIRVYSSEKGFSKIAPIVRNVAILALKFLKKTGCAVDVYLAGNEEIRTLNRVYLKKDGPTNILSFENKGFVRGDIGISDSHLGEIFLAPDVIKERGEDAGFLVIHGILHLAGYTHKLKSDRIKMEKKELEILAYVKHHYRA